ncbi:MAG: hypothetical protein IRZ32_03895 [Solirubrobacteraceae bacterium]|nr:hypothetical protein [Solirubrobacteraceae bacterium]
MNGVVIAAAWAAAAVNAAAAAWGGVCWSQFRHSPLFWALTRAGQALIVVFALVCGALVVAGHEPDEGLFWVYVLVPLGLSFVAEQFRIVSARTVLDQRDLPDVRAVAKLPVAEQEWIRTLVRRRETGVMALAAAANAFLLARAALTSAGF